jgi:hypothetical protein
MNLSMVDDDTEIVVVTDTVRQRRSRTPISAIINESNVVVMPDLLPKKDPFSDASGDETQSREVCSMVEVRERDLSMKMSVKNIEFEDAKVDTINIETCGKFEPEQVETVHIIDASSDTDTPMSTPLLDRKSFKSAGSMDELKTELKRELEAVSTFDEPVGEFCVKKQKTSFDEHKKLKGKDRDLLRDSEIAEEKAIKQMKLRPSLKELWMEERNSFYEIGDENNEEPLEFSDDEEIPRYSIEMDSDSDVVAFY